MQHNWWGVSVRSYNYTTSEEKVVRVSSSFLTPLSERRLEGISKVLSAMATSTGMGRSRKLFIWLFTHFRGEMNLKALPSRHSKPVPSGPVHGDRLGVPCRIVLLFVQFIWIQDVFAWQVCKQQGRGPNDFAIDPIFADTPNWVNHNTTKPLAILVLPLGFNTRKPAFLLDVPNTLIDGSLAISNSSLKRCFVFDARNAIIACLVYL
jgi:hypothetical protein